MSDKDLKNDVERMKEVIRVVIPQMRAEIATLKEHVQELESSHSPNSRPPRSDRSSPSDRGALPPEGGYRKVTINYSQSTGDVMSAAAAMTSEAGKVLRNEQGKDPKRGNLP